jgi:hypothetical protein
VDVLTELEGDLGCEDAFVTFGGYEYSVGNGDGGCGRTKCLLLRPGQNRVGPPLDGWRQHFQQCQLSSCFVSGWWVVIFQWVTHRQQQ